MLTEWTALQALRAVYLEGGAGKADYWANEKLLEAYDQTFARRIAWKWQWVLHELTRRAWKPPAEGGVLDWGCGTGIGSREFLGWDGGTRAVRLHDRSFRAMDYAEKTVRAEFPGCQIQPRGHTGDPAVLLVSHVLTELDDAGFRDLVAIAKRAQCLICVEPGTHAASDRLVALRQALLGEMHAVAPCLHSANCGLLTPENARHWCHYFADVPGEIFSDPEWMQFGKAMGIDLRSLPLSFLVMDRRAPVPASKDCVRVLGQPRMYKGYALLLGCQEPGVAEHRFQKREDSAYFRRLDKGKAASLQHWRMDAGGEITAIADAE